MMKVEFVMTDVRQIDLLVRMIALRLFPLFEILFVDCLDVHHLMSDD